jgi:hypothetical protein
MTPPIQFPQPQLTTGQKTGRYFIGIGLGFAPLILGAIIFIASAAIGGSLGSSDVGGVISTILGFVPLLLGLGGLGLMIYFLTQERFRAIGYGMLTVIVALPVIAAVGCIVILTQLS